MGKQSTRENKTIYQLFREAAGLTRAEASNVDLPLPEVPTTATNSPCSTVKFTPLRARVIFGSVP